MTSYLLVKTSKSNGGFRGLVQVVTSEFRMICAVLLGWNMIRQSQDIQELRKEAHTIEKKLGYDYIE